MTDHPSTSAETDPLAIARKIIGNTTRTTRYGMTIGHPECEGGANDVTARAAAVATAHALVDIAESLRVLAGRSPAQ